MKRLIVALLCALLLVSCASAPKYSSYVSLKGVNSAQAEFAAGDIIAELDEDGIGISDENPSWTIRFADIDESLGEQAYRVEVLGKIIEITGGDTTGLMYGGLEVAEQISLYGIEGIKTSEAEPFVQKRGIMITGPLDMRSPAYTTAGDSGQKNIPNVWDIEFWHEFLDNMSRNRMNEVHVFSLNHFPSLVKVEGYEDIALDDVWRTTLPLDNNFKGDMTNAIRPDDWENYEVVKEMTIEEKIDFWREVMAYGKERGIDFIMYFRHVYLYGEGDQNGLKYGLTYDLDNPVLKDYLYKSAKTLIETYPDMAGIGIEPGENMGWDSSEEGQYANLKWMHDVYVPAINEALAATPDREFELMIQKINLPEYAELYSDVNCDLTFMRAYTGTHMYATADPHEGDPYIKNIPEGTGLWFNFRNEDCFNMRWGDPDFMIEFVNNMPADKIVGNMTSSDGYFYGRDYSSTDEDLNGQLYFEKHWFNYMMLGRLMYDNTLSKERIEEIFVDHYDGMDAADKLFETTSVAGKIIPQVHQIYHRDNGDYTWFVEGCWSHPSTFGYLDIKRWVKSNNPFEFGNAMSIEEYAIRIAQNDDSPYTTQTPQEISDILTGYANEVLAGVADIRASVKPSKNLTVDEKNYWALVSDDEAMAYLGLFYAEKIMGAVELRVYNETQDTKWQDSSVAHLQKSADYFGKYAEIISSNYVPQYFARVGYFDVMQIYEGVKKDVTTAQKWKPMKITSSYAPPSKNDYFGDNK